MLSESFIASTLASSKTPQSATLRDVGICVHELQPAPALRSAFKKSSTSTNCLAVSASHVYAAQAEKAIVHVYSRERGNQEAVIPFPERIRSIALAGGENGDILILGTEGGRLIVWETCTGRQVSTTASHLQPVTSLVVDPTSNFVISGSLDATIYVWSLPGIISFAKPLSHDRQQSNSPVRSFSNHRAAITSLAVGHSNGRYNIAVSTSKDNIAIVWDYHTGRVLRTFLLPYSATSVTLDPVDRAFYVGYEDGSTHAINFYKNQSVQHPLHDLSLQSTPAQVTAESRWLPPSSESGAVESLAVSYDGTTLLSGHRDGKVLSWNIPRGKYASTVTDYTHPVTNLVMLPLAGLSHLDSALKRVSRTIVKPRYDHALSDSSNTSGVIPAEYTLSTQLLASSSSKAASKSSDFSHALTHAFFPQSIIEEGLAELANFGQLAVNGNQTVQIRGDSEAIAAKDLRIEALEREVSTLKTKVSVNENARHASTEEVSNLRSELARLQDYINELNQKQDMAQRERVLRKARKEEREAKRREAWFAAEKKGKNGDVAMKAADAEDSVLTSDTDDQSSGED
ncbi:hypothetical protein ASPZODRAFT_19539 [Penicilliopsis zonata CBS 506.65]|uniref:Pre-rRNA-processing protein IPI3 n=1 Tax=Penicilliopsis zonata CBS 506.65 TaxID=1073090 RepID=A0A1L9S8H0_9EURO|nr:hypothetical protein ASPZODRAFT_19539 [Penicilliopsis zonata CBS 506.65]OJJ43447.1 hypothetical protein ASPZODRAFT_19539 [Penicilliopsis zonata CBS 506.65]